MYLRFGFGDYISGGLNTFGLALPFLGMTLTGHSSICFFVTPLISLR